MITSCNNYLYIHTILNINSLQYQLVTVMFGRFTYPTRVSMGNCSWLISMTRWRFGRIGLTCSISFYIWSNWIWLWFVNWYLIITSSFSLFLHWCITYLSYMFNMSFPYFFSLYLDNIRKETISANYCAWYLGWPRSQSAYHHSLSHNEFSVSTVSTFWLACLFATCDSMLGRSKSSLVRDCLINNNIQGVALVVSWTVIRYCSKNVSNLCSLGRLSLVSIAFLKLCTNRSAMPFFDGW